MENGDKLLWINNNDVYDDNGDDEPDKIPTHHLGFCPLGFCPLGFILHTMMMGTLEKSGVDPGSTQPPPEDWTSATVL